MSKQKESKIALGLSEDRKAKKWYVDVIEYDPILGTAQLIERKDCGEYMNKAEDEYRKLAGEKVFP